MAATAARFDECDKPSDRIKGLRERKLGNTRTSIVFGSDKMNYESDYMSRQKDAMGGLGSIDYARARDLKKGLTMQNFTIGTDEEKYYKSTMSEMLASGIIGDKGSDEGPKQSSGNFARASSIHLGSDPGTYTTTNQDALIYKGGQIDYKKVKEDSAILKKELASHNFEFAHTDDGVVPKGHYSTTTADAFLYDTAAAMDAQAQLSKEVMADLRATHYSLGHEPLDYTTDAQEGSLAPPLGEGGQPRNPLDDKRAALALKKQLLTTSVVIGDDEDYF